MFQKRQQYCTVSLIVNLQLATGHQRTVDLILYCAFLDKIRCKRPIRHKECMRHTRHKRCIRYTRCCTFRCTGRLTKLAKASLGGRRLEYTKVGGQGTPVATETPRNASTFGIGGAKLSGNFLVISEQLLVVNCCSVHPTQETIYQLPAELPLKEVG